MTKIVLSKILDDRNQKLWTELKTEFKIELCLHDKPYAEMYLQKQNATIYLNENSSSASFTHELLHLRLEQQGIYIGRLLNSLISSNIKLGQFIPSELITHIGNTCEHVKMYEEFIRLGFNSNEFLFDNELHKCSQKEIRSIERNFKSRKKYNNNALEVFIGKFFAINADHNLEFDYSDCQDRLMRLDPTLYNILMTFWEEWLDFEILNENGIDYTFHEIAHNFYLRLDNWGRLIYLE